MKILSAAILIACVPLSTANAQLGKDASYFCVVEAVGGLSYSEQMKKWKGTVFEAGEKFVLRLKFLRSRAQKSAFDKDEIVHDYIVTITKSGTNFAGPCNHDGSIDTNEHVTVWHYAGVFACEAGLLRYRFNLKNNRFLLVHSVGYTDGVDSCPSRAAKGLLAPGSRNPSGG